MTDGLDQGGDGSATGKTPRIEAPADLGIEGRAEYERVRARLGLIGAHEGKAVAPLSLGRYRLERELGRGGMGVVYRAHDPELGRPVAIKLVRGLPFTPTDTLSTRLLREAKVLAKLTHPNVVRVYDVGSHEGEVYLAMEYVDGPTLREWQVGRTVQELLDAYANAARGLAAAHELGIVHRDFKPENVLVALDSRVLVSDFGLAGASVLREEEHSTLLEGADPELLAVVTKTGALLGTVGYMAPEQLRGETATPKSDQFAFCVSLWEALAGERPFLGGDREELLAAIEGPELPASERIPQDLRRLLQRGLATNPDDRFGDLVALVDAIPGPRLRSISLRGVGILVGVSLAIGLLASWFAFGTPSAERKECDLEVAVAAVQRSEALAKLRDRLAEAGVHEGLRDVDTFLERTSERASALCKPTSSPQIAGERQHLLAWVEFVEALAHASERPLSQLVEDIDELNRARLVRPPPRPLATDVHEALGISKVLMLEGDIEGALSWATRAVERANDDFVDVAVAEQQRGRLLAYSGSPEEALGAYREAGSAAEAAGYDDARLELDLLVARTAVMRQEDHARGRDALAGARGLFVHLGEPWWSPRRADYFEVRSAMSKHEGDFSSALIDQWWVVLLRTLSGSLHTRGRAYSNLGTIYEIRENPGDSARARAAFEYAVECLASTKPSHEWIQAEFSLAHLLASSEPPSYDEPFPDHQRAQVILRDIKERSKDLRRAAIVELLLLALRQGSSQEVASLAVALRKELDLRSPPPSAGFDAWSALASVAADSRDISTLRGAFAKAGRYAELLEAEGRPTDEVLVRRVGLELSLASILDENDDPNAKTFASHAKEHLSLVDPSKHPPGMMEAIELLLAP